MQHTDYSFYQTRSYKLAICLSIAIFFYIFMVFFLPFGVDNYNPLHEYTLNFFLEIFYFFVIILLCCLLNEFLLRPLFVKKTSLQNIILWSIWSFLLLDTVIFFTYNILGEWHDFRLKSYLEFLINCTSVLVFPAVGTFFYFRYRSLQQQINYILTSKEENTSETLIRFQGQGSKDQITLASSIFLYGQAQDNYVELYYLEQDQLAKFLMRASLSKLTESVNHPALIRCHRSFLVNLQQVHTVKSGRSELELRVGPFDSAVPVSRSYREEIVEQLKQLKHFS